MSKRSTAPLPAGEPPEPAIAHHYLLVPIVEVLVILALAWLGARFR
jgi:hypothetical protein